MTQQEQEQIYVAEEIIEVRYTPRGSFLPQMGNIADYIKDKGLFPNWEIGTGELKFRDAPQKAEKSHAFMSHKNLGFVAFDSPTRNFFSDKAAQYWRAIESNPYFALPDITRVGIRNKCFIGLDDNFEDIEGLMYEYFFKPDILDLVDMKRKDIQVVINFESHGVKLNANFGPLHKDEAERLFPFKSKYFSKVGIFVDLDWSIERSNIPTKEVESFLKKSSADSWLRIEKLMHAMGV